MYYAAASDVGILRLQPPTLTGTTSAPIICASTAKCWFAWSTRIHGQNTDPDLGANGQVTYSLEWSASSMDFELDSRTGKLSVASELQWMRRKDG